MGQAQMVGAEADEGEVMDDVSSLFSYDPENGVLRWKNGRGRVRSGDVAGNICPRGYVVVTVDKKLYRGHRIAWAIAYGCWPNKDLDVDHINGKNGDNRLCNLRLATRAQNLSNVRKARSKVSGAKGVYWSPNNKKWRVRIMKNGNVHELGLFSCLGVASKTRQQAALELNGEFAPIKAQLR